MLTHFLPTRRVITRMTRLRRILSALAVSAAALVGIGVHESHADLIVTVTPNLGGGTNWAFSGGSGVLGTAGNCCFAPGSTTLNFFEGVNGLHQDASFEVLAGTDQFGFNLIDVRTLPGFSGSNGPIFDVIDFQTSSDGLDGQSLSALNGLVLYADAIPFSGLIPGTYALNSYLTSSEYYTSLGTFTLNVVGDPIAPVPVPAVGAGLPGILALGGLLAWWRRRQIARA